MHAFLLCVQYQNLCPAALQRQYASLHCRSITTADTNPNGFSSGSAPAHTSVGNMGMTAESTVNVAEVGERPSGTSHCASTFHAYLAAVHLNLMCCCFVWPNRGLLVGSLGWDDGAGSFQESPSAAWRGGSLSSRETSSSGCLRSNVAHGKYCVCSLDPCSLLVYLHDCYRSV